MVMKLDEVVDLCLLLTPDAWKYDKHDECKYNYGKLNIVSTVNNYLGEREILASYDGNQFLWYKENYADSRYKPNKEFEKFIESNDFVVERAKLLLLK